MKNQWPLWTFIAAVVIIVFFAFNYQGKNEFVPLSEIFPEQEAENIPNFKYEYVNESEETGETTAALSETPPDVTKQNLSSAAGIPPISDKTEISRGPSSAPALARPDFSEVPFTIQISSYKDKNRAETALKGLKAAGYPADLVTKNLGEKGTWYRIYVGSFETKDQADAMLSKVKANYKDSFIISP